MSSKKKILIIQKVHEKGMELINNHPNFDVEVTEDVSVENLKSKIKDCDGASIRIAKLPGEVIQEAKNLKIISRHGVGYDNIDLKKTKEKDIKIAITANANAVTVSEHVMFVLLNIAKRKDLFDKTVRDGNFKDRNKLPKTIEIWKKNFLIMGFGRIGKALIKRCLGFEMEIHVYDPYVSSKIIESFGGKKINDLSSNLKKTDFLTIHMPLNKDTKNLINLKTLKTMKKEAIIVNTARGGIINEHDLNEALNKKYIFAAGLDVFEKEPPESNNPLLKNERVLLSPHSATFTKECKSRMSIETVQNLIDFFENKINNNMIYKL